MSFQSIQYWSIFAWRFIEFIASREKPIPPEAKVRMLEYFVESSASFFSEVSHLLNILVCYRLLIKQFCSFGVQHPFLVPSHFPIEHRVMRWFTFVECHYSHCCLWNSTGKKDLAYFYLVLYLLTVSILPNSLTQHQVCRLRGQARYQLDQFQAPHTAVVGCADCPVPWSWYLSETTKPGVIYNAY